MPQYTTNLRITKQNDDENPSTWGQVVNNQVIELLEEAISGVSTVNVAGSSNVDIASTVASGSSDIARHFVLELSGAVGANIELEVPSVEKTYIIKGGHTGSTVTVKPSGGSTGVDINPGDIVILYTNGTSITKVFPDLNIDDILQTSNNLSDLDDLATAQSNLGFGDFATKDIGAGFNTVGNTLSVAPFSVGMTMMTGDTTAPAQWEFCNGTTIGSAASAAAQTSNEFEDLFVHLWNQYPDSVCTVNGGRGASAAVDWSSNKTITLPNWAGRSPLGSGQGLTAEGGGTGTNRTVNTVGGFESHTLTTPEIPSHTHTFNRANGTGGPSDVFAGAGTVIGTGTTSATGGGDDHTNMHPFFVVNFIIFSGVA